MKNDETNIQRRRFRCSGAGIGQKHGAILGRIRGEGSLTGIEHTFYNELNQPLWELLGAPHEQGRAEQVKG